MSIRSLDHVNIHTDDLTGTCAFYEGLLGLINGDRPAFTFPGAWLYCGGVPVVHLIEVDKAKADHSGVIDHFAFGASDYDGHIKRLDAGNIDYEARDVPGGKLRQIFLKDPNGVNIELNFRIGIDT